MLSVNMSKRKWLLDQRRALARLRVRLEARMRLEELAAADTAGVSAADRELERLKYHYLPMWAKLRKRDAIERGLPSDVPYSDYMKPSVREFNEAGEDEPDRDACAIVDKAIDELVGAGGFRLARAVLAVRYLNAAGASVYRSGRVHELETKMVEDLCDRAERQLVPIVLRMGLPL